MQWWAWVSVGAVLLGAELTFVNAQFYLVFLGASALLVGVLPLAGIAVAAGTQWGLFAALSLVSLFAFRRRVYERLRRRLPVVQLGPEDDQVVLGERLGPGERCRVEFRGTTWDAVNAGERPIAAGARARIERMDRLTLMLRAEE